MVYMIHRQVNDAPRVARTATAAVTFLPHSRWHLAVKLRRGTWLQRLSWAFSSGRFTVACVAITYNVDRRQFLLFFCKININYYLWHSWWIKMWTRLLHNNWISCIHSPLSYVINFSRLHYYITCLLFVFYNDTTAFWMQLQFCTEKVKC